MIPSGWQRFERGQIVEPQTCTACGRATEQPAALGWLWRTRGGDGVETICHYCRDLHRRYAAGAARGGRRP